ncbi:MAG: aminotransferase class I/II-fold pyridoxal phosphate-dependent enzyme [Burkholderiaceae bacterium]|nr:aminotransferase class I/II-fold pyridoxal phosphate-dependent enzyme [Burkholderiaceae bacterium]
MTPVQLLSERAQATRPFYVMELLARAAAREPLKGPSVSMVVGEPDFPPPPPVVRAAQAALAQGGIHYTHTLGMPELREAIANDYLRRDGLQISIDRVAVTAGASGGLLLVMAALLNPGDEVIMPDPSYPCNREFVSVMGGVVKTIPVDAASGFQPTVDAVRQAWGPRTRALLVASPANPTGTMIATDQAQSLAQTVRELGGVMIIDEIYQRLAFEGNPKSLLSLGDDVISINSFSKTFSMTGWRLGWVVAPTRMIAAIERLSQNLFISTSSLSQRAALAAFEPESLAVAEAYRQKFREQGRYLLTELQRLGFQLPAAPDGAFYGYCDVSALTRDSFQFCIDLCDQAGVLMTPGRDFGDYQAEKFLRVSYTKPLELLQEGVHRLKVFLEKTQ